MTACPNGVQLMLRCSLSFAKIVQTECNRACSKLLRCSLSSAKITEKIDIPILFGIFFMYKQEIVETHESYIPTISNQKEFYLFTPLPFGRTNVRPYMYLTFYLFTVLPFYL